MKVELDLSNYTTKTDFKNAAGVNTLKFARKFYLSGLKSETDKLDIDKLETNPVDLSKLSDAVKNEFIKKTVYDELVKKVNAIHTTDISNLLKKNWLWHKN